jgi:hypothetical protein
MTKTSPPLPTADAAAHIPRFFFDRRDHELIRIINEIYAHDHALDYVRRQYYSYFHPHGIKEMAEWHSLRIAYAMVRLLTSLEIGAMEDRLSALNSLRAEVLDTAEGPMPKNTARALMQIMKEVVRTRDDPLRQLQLAHDFRITASGKPRVVRRQLRNYHLLEMPEAWNQLAFDDHVHDANTKGRKSSTHLIMDAWIKGIRRLRVVHYNFIEPRTAAELLEAASIMDIDVRIGIEFYARFRDKYTNLIWVPRGFPDAQAFLCFLEEPAVVALMDEGRHVSQYQQIYVMKLLEAFNRRHRPELNHRFDVEVEALDPGEFLRFVGMGQKSVLHLDKFIQEKMLAAMHRRAGQLRAAYPSADSREKERIEAWFKEMDCLDLDGVVAAYLKPANNPDIPDHTAPREDPDVPALLRQSPPELLYRLASLQSGYRITLNLSNLVAEDVLELLYDANGMITRLELFNLKDWTNGRTDHIPAISCLQETINSRNPIKLKRVILENIQRAEKRQDPYRTERIAKLKIILHDIISLQAMYKSRMLKARMGSDSTGRTPRFHGMGLAVIDTLPLRARRQIRKDLGSGRDRIPIHISVQKNLTFVPPCDEHPAEGSAARTRILSALRAIRPCSLTRLVTWSIHIPGTRMERPGNVITLGGVQQTIQHGLSLSSHPRYNHSGRIPLRYVNSHLRNLFKVLAGFIPAFATFFLTKDWWLLAYMGAFIWFAITGVRNILQSVLGGGGLRRSPLLRWNAYVSWDRIADSLLFTGFSVPLLDYLTKTVVLDRLFGITTSTAPILLYTVMALVNGVYISTHNAFRGLPRAAIYGNFFRSALSIPIAIAINFVAGQALAAAGTVTVAQVLQKWAAIISKTASDLVAGIIEGAADRGNNIRIRFKEYRKKLAELLDIYAQLELLYPEAVSYELTEASWSHPADANIEAHDLEKIITIHALDLLYFWMYQPRARSAMDQLLRTINEEERHLLITSQFTLLRQREISQMFIDGILGNDFARALSFYLSRSPDYLEAMKKYV